MRKIRHCEFSCRERDLDKPCPTSRERNCVTWACRLLLDGSYHFSGVFLGSRKGTLVWRRQSVTVTGCDVVSATNFFFPNYREILYRTSLQKFVQ